MQSAAQAYVLEVNDGFLVRYQSPENPWQMISARLTLGELRASDAYRRGRRSGQQQNGDTVTAGRYQDVMRAIGYHLEQVSARDIVLDEVDGSYAVTYHYIPTDDMTRRKHRTIITPSDADELLCCARARRGTHAGWRSDAGESRSAHVHVVRT
jgi:hypothetical protein